MASKKYMLILGLLALVSFSYSQNSGQGVAEWKDSSLIPPSRMAQHNEFVNNQYIFPSKPRSQWEVGLKVGTPNVGGDVQANFPTFGFGVHARKALGYIVSLRAEYFNGTATGLSYKPNNNYAYNTAWTSTGYNKTEMVYYNYKTKINDLSMQMLFNFSNIRFHRAEPKFGLYAITGVGLTSYTANIDALNAGGQKYNFSSISGGVYANRNDTKTALKALLDGTYETPGEKVQGGSSKFKLSTTLGIGAAFKLSKKVNIAIEDRLTMLKDDLLDGQRYSPYPVGNPAFTPQNDSYNFFSVGVNINIL